MTEFEKSWAEFKAVHAMKELPKSAVQFGSSDMFYDIAFADGPFVFFTRLVKNGGADVLEFEADWMPEANGAAV